jgi:hypothetical protein
MQHDIRLVPKKPLLRLNDEGKSRFNLKGLPRIRANAGLAQEANFNQSVLNQPLANSPGPKALRKQQVLKLHDGFIEKSVGLRKISGFSYTSCEIVPFDSQGQFAEKACGDEAFVF